ncbi:MerC domain-containing protein [Asticcacaulis sp. AND118]|uniref:MerC domain-containing protein n=1 Tax=Asticcacaulis sp. AND118 TaxID=2840468 RepID=UPI001CFFEE35|nr:MerC domain-containing protein [Asticcacaulis sp. AND118]UDF04042.1 MerC domain-containing protein [Asticcacaulis sp. AND118]
MIFRPKRPSEFADLIGLFLSIICVVHCLALPAVILLLPSLGVFFQAHWIHQVLIALAAPVSLWAILRSGLWRQYQVGIPMAFGIALLALAAFYKPVEAFEAPVSILGAGLLAFGHYRNTRLVHSVQQSTNSARSARGRTD